MTILSEYSFWLIALCIALGVLYSFILYYKNKTIEYEKKSLRFMCILRGLAVTLIALLLLAPMIKMTVKKSEKPVLIFAVDNSESIVSAADSSWYRTQFMDKYHELVQKFTSQYKVVQYLIGDQDIPFTDPSQKLPVQFSDKSTQLASIFDQIELLYANQNVGALVMFTDGIFNAGANPYYKANKVRFPVYTIGMGNPEIQTDLFIVGISHNNQTFKGNFFPVEIRIAATKLAGKNIKLTVSENNEELFAKSLSISGNQYFESVKFSLEAKEKGMHRYQVSLTELEDEITYKNNHASFFIEVVDQREKIAIIYAAPHPDISAIKSALEISDKYQIQLFSADEFKENLDAYSLLILHQLPSIRQPATALLEQIQKNAVSTLFICGNQTNYNAFNTLNTGLTILKNKELYNDATPAFNENFISFTFSEEAKKMLLRFPPLTTPFGEYKSIVSSNVFMFQKINNVITNYPLIIFNDKAGFKIGIVSGTGLWQWKMYNYLYAANQEAFNEIINKIALYLSAKGDKSYFRVYAKNIYRENAPVDFTAELYNESYELQNDPEVEMEITGKDGHKYSARFSKQNKGYFLNMGEMSPGEYRWKAVVRYGNNTYTKNGAFHVQEMMIEMSNLVADHNILQNISQATDGQFFKVTSFEDIEKVIKNNDNIKTVALYSHQYSNILNMWIYFALIVLLLGIEWFMRKWGGGY